MIEEWFEKHGITPTIVAEFDDSALTKTFAQQGVGVFAAPVAIEHEITQQFDVVVVGRTDDLLARFYAISTERRIRHPAVVADHRARPQRPVQGRAGTSASTERSSSSVSSPSSPSRAASMSSRGNRHCAQRARRRPSLPDPRNPSTPDGPPDGSWRRRRPRPDRKVVPHNNDHPRSKNCVRLPT